jgi:hypothetical protein
LFCLVKVCDFGGGGRGAKLSSSLMTFPSFEMNSNPMFFRPVLESRSNLIQLHPRRDGCLRPNSISREVHPRSVHNVELGTPKTTINTCLAVGMAIITLQVETLTILY